MQKERGGCELRPHRPPSHTRNILKQTVNLWTCSCRRGVAASISTSKAHLIRNEKKRLPICRLKPKPSSIIRPDRSQPPPVVDIPSSENTGSGDDDCCMYTLSCCCWHTIARAPLVCVCVCGVRMKTHNDEKKPLCGGEPLCDTDWSSQQ